MLGHKDTAALAMNVYGHLREEHSFTVVKKDSFMSTAFRIEPPIDFRTTLDSMGLMSTTTAPIDIGTLITRSPEIKGGNPRIAGTGVTVQRIVGWYKQGLNAEDIAREIPHLTVGQVYAALAYYHANTEEIERLLAEEEADYDRLCAEFSQKRPAGA